MLVERVMKQNVITLQPAVSIAEALLLFKKHRIRNSPIVHDLRDIGFDLMCPNNITEPRL